ncbi:hypothetical protein FOA52_014850 [Chlamydomonas sp. UWO 241]|nr:hypothetical protein FOA52_014850 [Chlamydomonas sp. UWO 241]
MMVPPASPSLHGGSPASTQKRTFKTKLENLLAEAEHLQTVALAEAQSQDAKSLSIMILLEGRPQAFVDFFAVTQGHASTSGRGAEHQLPQEALLLLKAQLVKADAARVEGRTEDVFAALKVLAKYFLQLGRLRHAEFFFKRAQSVARDAGWVKGDLEASVALGLVYEELQDVSAAVACHEQRLQVASEHGLQDDMDAAYQSLTGVYLGMAEKEDKAGDSAAALTSFAKCLSAAERAGDAAVAAKAHFRMGLIHFGAGRVTDSTFHLRRFVEDGAAALGDRVAEGVAHTTLAQCLLKSSPPDTEGAVALLEAFLDTSGRTASSADQHGPAMACCSLGTIYLEQGEHLKAVNFFERFFEVARGLGDRKILDTARFNLGVAKGMLRSDAFMQVVANDLPKLLEWKASRADFIWVLATVATFVALPLLIWDFTSKGFDIKKQAWFIGGLFVLLSFPVSLYEIALHTEYYAVPKLQRHIIRILWMVPIYGIDAWFALRFQAAREYLDPIRECYEAFVIYNFYAFLMNYLSDVVGDVEAHMAKKTPMRHLPVFRLFLRPWEMGAPFLLQIKKGILNYVIIRPLCSALALSTDMFGMYGQGVITYRKSYVYLAVATSLSQLWAMYCLVQLYQKTHAELAPIRPLSKFIVVKAVVFVSFWQGVVLAILVATGVIYRDTWTYSDQRNMAASIQDFLICIEMFFAALAHAYSFPPRDYMEIQIGTGQESAGFFANLKVIIKILSYKEIQITAGLASAGFFANLEYMFDLRDVVDDVSVVVASHGRDVSETSVWAAKLPKRALKSAAKAPGRFISILIGGGSTPTGEQRARGGGGGRAYGGVGGSSPNGGSDDDSPDYTSPSAALLSPEERARAQQDHDADAAAESASVSGAGAGRAQPPPSAGTMLSPWAALVGGAGGWVGAGGGGGGGGGGAGGTGGARLGTPDKAASEPADGGGSAGGTGSALGAFFIRRSSSESDGLSATALRSLFCAPGQGGGNAPGRGRGAGGAGAAREPRARSQPRPGLGGTGSSGGGGAADAGAAPGQPWAPLPGGGELSHEMSVLGDDHADDGDGAPLLGGPGGGGGLAGRR